MATVENVKKKIVKLCNRKTVTIDKDSTGRYSVLHNGHKISFRANGRDEPGADASNFYTQRIGDEDDSMTDYFSGTFHDNITQAFRFVEMQVAELKIRIQKIIESLEKKNEEVNLKNIIIASLFIPDGVIGTITSEYQKAVANQVLNERAN